MSRPALCQPEHPGIGKPLFKTPHSVRQRRACVKGLCDLCGLPLGEEKVSLSFERSSDVGLIQVEPFLHRRCAAISMQFCPHLKRHVSAGSLIVRDVKRYDIAVARLTAAAVKEFSGETWRDGEVYGHAKLLVRRAVDRDVEWVLSSLSREDRASSPAPLPAAATAPSTGKAVQRD